LSAHLAAQTADQAPLRELQAWIADHLDADLTVAAMAERVEMSERSFARAFTREVGVTPGAFVETLRVQRACVELETTSASTVVIAKACGFGAVQTMRRAFARRLGVSPGAYRERRLVA
jgi:transcriptional regulator GlxA family with amidase domain